MVSGSQAVFVQRRNGSGSDTDPRQVKAVGVPAGPDGHILVVVSVRMARNGVGQQGELAVI